MMTTAEKCAAFLAKLDELHQHVLDLANEHPDRVYVKQSAFVIGAATRCWYEKDADNPDGCIIGAALRRLGHRFPRDTNPKALRATGVASEVVRQVLSEQLDETWEWTWEGGAVEAERWAKLLYWFTDVQAKQDVGSSWGAAVAACGYWEEDRAALEQSF